MRSPMCVQPTAEDLRRSPQPPKIQYLAITPAKKASAMDANTRAVRTLEGLRPEDIVLTGLLDDRGGLKGMERRRRGHRPLETVAGAPGIIGRLLAAPDALNDHPQEDELR